MTDCLNCLSENISKTCTLPFGNLESSAREEHHCTISGVTVEVCGYYTGSSEEGVANCFICAKGNQEAF